MRTIVGILVLAGVVGGAYLLNYYTRGKDGKSVLNVARELDIPVETAQPEQRDIVRTVQAPGEVEAFAEVDISSEVVAKILNMPVEEGDVVKAGQLLCQLDDADYQARVVSAGANVAKLRAMIIQAEADLQIAERDWDQAQRLRELNATSEMEVANYRTALVKARALIDVRGQELIEAEAVLQSAKENLARTVIKSPIDGIVAQRFAKQGEVVITGTMNNPGTRIMVISDLSKMQVRCRVDEADAPLVAQEQTSRIYLQSDTRRSIAGQVMRVGTKGTKPLGRDVVTFETLVLITGDDPRVKPGMTANVEIEVARREQALTVPVQAVVYRKRRDLPEDLVQQLDAEQAGRDAASRQNLAEYIRLVFCIEDGKARPRLVQTGINDANLVEIVRGIAVGDAIVTGPYRSLDQLKEGSAVKVDKHVEAVAVSVAASQPSEAEPATAAAEGEATPTSAPAPDASEEQSPPRAESSESGASG